MNERTVSSEVVNLDDATFDAAVASGVVLVDFWAPWCGPCRMMGPVLHELASEAGPGVTVAKVNVDDSPHLSGRFRVQAIPLLVVLRDGREVARLVGLQSKDSLRRALAMAQEA
mgnify:CR=1 FL=1